MILWKWCFKCMLWWCLVERHNCFFPDLDWSDQQNCFGEFLNISIHRICTPNCKIFTLFFDEYNPEPVFCRKQLMLWSVVSTLQKRAVQAEEELTRGKTKLKYAFFFKDSSWFTTSFLCFKFLVFCYRQAGKQIQGVIRSAYKIERQAGGMQILLLAGWLN